MKKNSITSIVIFIVASLFLLVVAYSRFNSVDKTLKFSHEVNLEVIKIKRYRGVMLLNDSIAVFENSPRINIDTSEFNYYKRFKDLTKPFRLIKAKDNNSILVIKDSDSLYYKLIE